MRGAASRPTHSLSNFAASVQPPKLRTTSTPCGSERLGPALQLGNVIAETGFQLIFGIESQLVARADDVHARPRRRQLAALHDDAREDRAERAFDVLDRGQRAAAEVIDIMRQCWRMQ